MKHLSKLLLVLIVFASIIIPAAAAEKISPQEQALQALDTKNTDTQEKTLEAIELLVGFGHTTLRHDLHYTLYPLMVDFDFNLKVLTKKINFNPPQLLQFQIEPFISTVSQPDANIEGGISFYLKTGFFPQDWKLQPYIRAGAGIVYMSTHTIEQSTQFNFIEQGSGGIHYYVTPKIALTLEGSYRHFSNCGIRIPNRGINTGFFNTGLCYKF